MLNSTFGSAMFRKDKSSSAPILSKLYFSVESLALPCESSRLSLFLTSLSISGAMKLIYEMSSSTESKDEISPPWNTISVSCSEFNALSEGKYSVQLMSILSTLKSSGAKSMRFSRLKPRYASLSVACANDPSRN